MSILLKGGWQLLSSSQWQVRRPSVSGPVVRGERAAVSGSCWERGGGSVGGWGTTLQFARSQARIWWIKAVWWVMDGAWWELRSARNNERILRAWLRRTVSGMWLRLGGRPYQQPRRGGATISQCRYFWHPSTETAFRTKAKQDNRSQRDTPSWAPGLNKAASHGPPSTHVPIRDTFNASGEWKYTFNSETLYVSVNKACAITFQQWHSILILPSR